MRERSGQPAGAGPTTARVNGRTVRARYKIQNGDVLTPLQVTGLNSLAWVAPRGEGGGGRGGKKTGVRAGSASEFEAVDLRSLPVPWPWSLVGSDADAWRGCDTSS